MRPTWTTSESGSTVSTANLALTCKLDIPATLPVRWEPSSTQTQKVKTLGIIIFVVIAVALAAGVAYMLRNMPTVEEIPARPSIKDELIAEGKILSDEQLAEKWAKDDAEAAKREQELIKAADGSTD